MIINVLGAYGSRGYNKFSRLYSAKKVWAEKIPKATETATEKRAK